MGFREDLELIVPLIHTTPHTFCSPKPPQNIKDQIFQLLDLIKTGRFGDYLNPIVPLILTTPHIVDLNLTTLSGGVSIYQEVGLCLCMCVHVTSI